MMRLLHQRKLILFFLCFSGFVGFYLLLSRDMKLWPTNDGDLIRFQRLKDYWNNSLAYFFSVNADKISERNLKEHVINQQGNPIHTMADVPLNQNRNFYNEKPPKPAQPTEPDFIGDKYTIDDVPPQTNCPTSIRQKVMKTAFAKKFLWNVPVLQWAKHFSQAEYQRLSRYNGAHGWGSVDVDVLKNTLALLNTSANQLMFADWDERKSSSGCIRCAVVGNGGILNGCKKGREIDEHDYVFRTNGVIIKGFEDDVGTRTSLFTFSFNTLHNSLYNYRRLGFIGAPQGKETDYVFLPDHDKDYKLLRSEVTHTPFENSEMSPHYFGSNVTVEKFKMYHPDFIRYLRNRFLHSHILNTQYKNIYRPSTGAVMLLAALHTCDYVSAYGFITPDYNKYSDHYYDKIYNKLYFYANHDMRMELSLWQELHKAGLLQLYMRT